MDRNVTNNITRMKSKIPEIKSSLEAVQHLKKKKEEEVEQLKSQFKLTDGVYANALLKLNGKVSLWLGANLMVEYSYEEAEELLSTNLETATRNLENSNEDSAYLKDQITITEVNVARIHNYAVKQNVLKKK
jgi:prefoldin subunit 5